MDRLILYLNVIIFLLCFTQLEAQDDQSLITSANVAYEQGSWNEAIQAYTKILDNGHESVALYNNLGSAYYKNGDIPNAILYFEKGLKLDPFDKSMLHNLNIAREQLDNGIVQIPEFIIMKAWKYMFTRCSSNTWYIFGFLSAFLAVFAFGVWLLNSSRDFKKKGFFAGFFFLGLSVLLFALSSSQAKFQYNTRTAIVFDQNVDLKSAPEEANEAIMTLVPGTKLKIIDQIGDYHKVRLVNGQLGWVPKDSFEDI
jgi:tetratricopeptide (TPR) repeat protein